MMHIVITGSTRGIGLGLAKEFLALECSVTFSGRAQQDVDRVIGQLSSHYPSEKLLGLACDVRDPVQVQALWDTSFKQFGKVDIWINNAGYSGPQLPAWEIDPEKADPVTA